MDKRTRTRLIFNLVRGSLAFIVIMAQLASVKPIMAQTATPTPTLWYIDKEFTWVESSGQRSSTYSGPANNIWVGVTIVTSTVNGVINSGGCYNGFYDARNGESLSSSVYHTLESTTTINYYRLPQWAYQQTSYATEAALLSAVGRSGATTQYSSVWTSTSNPYTFQFGQNVTNGACDNKTSYILARFWFYGAAPTTPTPTATPECDTSLIRCKLRHYWPMDETTTGDDRLDHIGGATLQAANVAGTENSKYGFGAAQLSTGQYMYSESTPETLSPRAAGWSIAGWFRPQGTPSAKALVLKTDEYTLSLTSDSKVQFVAGSTTITSVDPVTYDAWHLITVIYDGSAWTFQLDAQSAITTNGSAAAVTNAPITYGGYNNSGTLTGNYSGRLDEWSIWERAITQDQRNQLWNNGEGCFYPWIGNCNSTPGDTLLDGGMEQYPGSSGWAILSGGTFGTRINRNTVIGWLQFFTIGPSKCGDGYHQLRTDVQTVQDQQIGQNFSWSGGDFYWKVASRGQRALIGTISPNLQPRAYVYLLDTQTQVEYILIDDPTTAPQTGEWKTNGGQITSLPTSTYRIVLGSYDGASVFYDDVAIGNGPLDEACTEKLEPSPTPTPSATTFVTATLQSGISTVTNTPGPSPTPSSLLLSNCGFEVANHAGWVLNAQSYIANAGGPIGPMYLVAQSNPPGAYQTIFVNADKSLYFTAYVKSYAQIRLVNTSDSRTVSVYSDYTTSWVQIKRMVSVPAGYWRVELNASSLYAAGNFDGVDVSANGYTQPSNFCINTPTAGPTSFVTPSFTPTRTTTPVRTNTPVIYTVTPMPSRTPYGTPGGPEGPWTATPNLTSTAIANITATWVATTTGTPTVDASQPKATDDNSGSWNGGDPPPNPFDGTPVPSVVATWTTGDPVPGDGPPGFWIPGDGGTDYIFVECQRPVNPWSIAWWIDYERCLLFAFVSWGPQQQSTAVNIPQMFNTYEPFGTMNEVRSGIISMRTEVASYRNNSGYAGVNDSIDPSNILQGQTYDPWATGQQLRLGESGTGITSGAYTEYCSSRLSSELSGNLAKGACFALNVMRNIGLLPWVQFLINILAIGQLIWSAFAIVGIYTVHRSATPVQTKEED